MTGGQIMTAAHTRNPHDDGLDIATGQDVSAGRVIGTVHLDGVGLVLRFHDPDGRSEAEHLPDTVEETVQILAERGYQLDDASINEIRDLTA